MNVNSILLSFFALIFIVSGETAVAQDIDTKAWVADFAQLKREMSTHYANMDWAVQTRKLDLRSLSERTESRLLSARNELEAKKNIESFLAAFGDGHLMIEWPGKSNNSSSSNNEPRATQISLCERLSFQQHKQAAKIAFTLLKNFEEINTEDSKYFPIGLLHIDSSKVVGILRISIFSEYAFPDLCEQVSAEMKLMKDSPCDEGCADLVERSAANLLTKALVRQIENLKRKKLSALLIDITGNGGGTNWVEPAARTLTAKRLKSPRQQFIRHVHWTREFRKRLEIIKEESQKVTGKMRDDLQHAGNILRTALLESEKTCDRNVIWENQKPECSLVVETPKLYPQRVLDAAQPGSLPDLSSSRALFYPSRYEYKEGIYSGKLIILVDQGTWSSAEYFAAILRDNNAATLIGEPTGGAGCGYTNGGIPTVLKNSGAKVKIPDCVRLRADGSNEVAGITPDILIPWRQNDNSYQRVERVVKTIVDQTNSKTKK